MKVSLFVACLTLASFNHFKLVAGKYDPNGPAFTTLLNAFGEKVKKIDESDLKGELQKVFKLPVNILSIEPNDWLKICVDATGEPIISENQNRPESAAKIWLDFMLNSTGTIDNELRAFLGDALKDNFSFLINRTINKIANERADIQNYSNDIYNSVLMEPAIQKTNNYGPLLDKFDGKTIGKRQLKNIATRLKLFKLVYNDICTKLTEQVNLTISTKNNYLTLVNLTKTRMNEFLGLKGTLAHLSTARDIVNNLRATQNKLMGPFLEISTILENYDSFRFKWAKFLINI